jgi:tRNA A-37 threonylcarbamoyl transferase component Bud32
VYHEGVHERDGETAQRIAWLATASLVGIPTVLGLWRLGQPQLAPVLGDPVNRLAALCAVLVSAAVIALHRYDVVRTPTLLALGMAVEVLAPFPLAMVETSRPFGAYAPIVGISGVALWIVASAATVRRAPNTRLALALAAATTWPLAYFINTMRFGFSTGSWLQTAIWPSINYALAAVVYVAAAAAARTHRRPSAAPEATPTGDLGSYELTEVIGQGAMGEVWRARHRVLGRQAAIKLLLLDAGSRDMLVQRFHREAQAIAALQSPHAVFLYDFGVASNERLYYAMELLDGITLQTLLTSFGPVPAPRVVHILRQICECLDEAHANDILHRDLKPSNVMLCAFARRHDFVKVIDFGLAKPFGEARPSNLTAYGVTPGTPEFMAPEVALANPSIDGRADLYAVGCIAYVLLTGTLVFSDANPMNVALRQVQVKPDPPSRRTSSPIPRDLEQIVLACLEKDPAARPATARDLEQMLVGCDVPPWTDEDATAWWERHLPPASSLRAPWQQTSGSPARRKASR